MTKPFIKWVGGKSKLCPQLSSMLPDDLDSDRVYYEPFLGGGAMFFHRKPLIAVLSDVNPDLVITYKAVRDDCQVLRAMLAEHQAKHSDAYYTSMRNRFNQPCTLAGPERAAAFIYLNKTCFNGLYRVNRKGEFNVPIGSYKNPVILDTDVLIEASDALQGYPIHCARFETVLSHVKEDGFAYLDPPYDPVSKSANFASYAKDGFTRDDQILLRKCCDELSARGGKFMLSNSDTPFIRELWSGYRIETIQAARAINCDGAKRGKVNEVVVTNYEPRAAQAREAV